MAASLNNFFQFRSDLVGVFTHRCATCSRRNRQSKHHIQPQYDKQISAQNVSEILAETKTECVVS